MKLHKKIIKKNNIERNNFKTSLNKYLLKKKEESIINKKKLLKNINLL